jgi:hypothetical protein
MCNFVKTWFLVLQFTTSAKEPFKRWILGAAIYITRRSSRRRHALHPALGSGDFPAQICVPAASHALFTVRATFFHPNSCTYVLDGSWHPPSLSHDFMCPYHFGDAVSIAYELRIGRVTRRRYLLKKLASPQAP